MENLTLEHNLSNSNSYASDKISLCYAAARAPLWESPDRDLELQKPLSLASLKVESQ